MVPFSRLFLKVQPVICSGKKKKYSTSFATEAMAKKISQLLTAQHLSGLFASKISVFKESSRACNFLISFLFLKEN